MDSSDQNIQNNEAFLKLFLKHESGLKAYIRSCVIKPEEVDEIMQEVSLVGLIKLQNRGGKMRVVVIGKGMNHS